MKLPSMTTERPELVCPAGNFDKLRFAVAFGADAVYFGGEEFNLRSQADNFGDEETARAVAYCRERGVRAVFLLNAYLHESDIPAARVAARAARDLGPDAVMASDPGMIALLREEGIACELHLSTQMSTLNHLALRFWADAGITRVVLAREATLEEIRAMRAETGIQIEVFVHGALCVSYSGRCLLSRYLAGRDANAGDCAHPCRWTYSLVEQKRPGDYLDIVEHERGTEILASRDLCLVGKLPQYAGAGVDAFKIEGRMKSLYYAANTARIYLDAIKTSGTGEFERRLPFYENELDLVSHRPYTDDIFNEFGGGGYTPPAYVNRAMFMGYRDDGDSGSHPVVVKIRNPFRRGQTLEAIYPIHDTVRDRVLTVETIHDDSGAAVDMARPGGRYLVSFDGPVEEFAVFRRLVDA